MDPTTNWNNWLAGQSYLETSYQNTGNPSSSARGYFQFINPTAQRAQNAGLPDPRAGGYDDQANAAKAYIQHFHPDAASAIDSGDFGAATKLLRGEWPSLPGGSQPQNSGRYSTWSQILNGQGPRPDGSSSTAPMSAALAQNTYSPQGRPTMSDQSPALFGGNPTPVGLAGGIGRMLGIGTEPELGRRLQNAGAALMSVGNFGKPGMEGAAAMQAAANQPHYNIVADPYGNRYAIDTRTGRPISLSAPGAQAPGFNNQVGGPQGQQEQPQQAQPGGPLSYGGVSDYDGLLGPDMIKQAHEDSQKRMDAMDQAAASAQSTIDLNNQAMRLSQDPGTQAAQGPGLGTMIRDKTADATNGSFSWGGGIDIAKVHDLDKLHAKLVANNLKDMPGVKTALPEIRFGEQASADLEKPAATNQQIYSNNIQDAQRVLDARKIARQHYANGGILGPAFSKHLEDYQSAHPVAQDDAVKTKAPGAAPGFKILSVTNPSQ